MKCLFRNIAMLISFSSAVACGSGNAVRADPLNGTYNAVSLNGSPLPATYTVGQVTEHVFSRKLWLLNGTGGWDDSTVVTVGNTETNASHHAFIQWHANGSNLTVTGGSLALFFIINPDGSLTSDFNDGMTIIYKR